MKNKNTVFLNVPDYEGAAVYALVDENGKKYIGSTNNFQNRIRSWNVCFRSTMRIGEGGRGCPKDLADAIISGERFRVKILRKLPSDMSYQDRTRNEQKEIDACGGIQKTYNVNSARVNEKLSNAHKRANAKWDAANLKRLSLAMLNADYQAMRQHLDGRDETQNGFINRAIREAIKNDTVTQKGGEEN